MASVNLANVNISLNEFQRLSQGDHNAGEVRLAGENKLAKVNNHVHRTGLNVVAIPHAEVLAIKEALVRALAGGAVTIRYSEPEGFPVKFHWEAKIDVDGKTAATPLVIEEAAAQ